MSTTAPVPDRRSVYQVVTDRIVAALERGVAPFPRFLVHIYTRR